MKEPARNNIEMDDFLAITSDYEHRINQTMEEIDGAWVRYTQNTGQVHKRRREALITILRNISKWREMASYSEVVLGTGSMLQHRPLHLLINAIDRSNPACFDMAVLSQELVNLIKHVSDQINSATNEYIEEDSEMEAILNAKGIYPNEDDTDDIAAINHEIIKLVGDGDRDQEGEAA